MRDLNQQERIAIEAVASRFSATWEKGTDSSDAHITITGKQVAVDITTLERRGASQRNTKLCLRFDKVATRLMDRLQAALAETVPDGMTVLLTITAPIRLPSKTAAALEDKIQAFLAPGRDQKHTINGNRIQIRILRHNFERVPKLLAFVHNPDSDPLLLLNMTCELVERISAKARRPATQPSRERWLVLISALRSSYLEAYRHICSQLCMASYFKKVFIVFSDNRVEPLME